MEAPPQAHRPAPSHLLPQPPAHLAGHPASGHATDNEAVAEAPHGPLFREYSARINEAVDAARRSAVDAARQNEFSAAIRRNALAVLNEHTNALECIELRMRSAERELRQVNALVAETLGRSSHDTEPRARHVMEDHWALAAMQDPLRRAHDDVMIALRDTVWRLEDETAIRVRYHDPTNYVAERAIVPRPGDAGVQHDGAGRADDYYYPDEYRRTIAERYGLVVPFAGMGPLPPPPEEMERLRRQGREPLPPDTPGLDGSTRRD